MLSEREIPAETKERGYVRTRALRVLDSEWPALNGTSKRTRAWSTTSRTWRATRASFNVLETDGALAADIKLKVGDGVFYANKGYLSVVSSVFRDMFAFTEAAERNEEREEIELKDLDAGEFKEFLGVIYPTRYPITDANVISIFRIADRYDVKRVVAECERHLAGVNKVPWFDKLKLAVDLNREQLKDHLISKMTCKDVKAIDQNENKSQLGLDVLQDLLHKHIAIHHP
ncbi:Protein BATH-38 [Aphelenchoides avenae]|nr:Protein BATH-38 [Aphelenchus avenae]